MRRPEEFRSLAEFLRPPADASFEIRDDSVEARERVMEEEAPPEVHEILRDVRTFRAHLRDALERCVERLLERIARDVLARECAIAPVDIERIIEGALKHVVPDSPFTVHVSEADLSRLQHSRFPIEADTQMESGDIALILEGGTITSTLKLRLDNAIAEALSVMHDC